MTEVRASGDCPFCAIAAGQTPAALITQSSSLVAFLDGNPIRRGHLRIVPRAHFPHFNALPPGLAADLLDLGQRLAAAQRSLFKVDRVGFLFPADAIPHAQVQLVPLLSAGDVAGRRAPVAAAAFHAGACGAAGELTEIARCLGRELDTGADALDAGQPCPDDLCRTAML